MHLPLAPFNPLHFMDPDILTEQTKTFHILLTPSHHVLLRQEKGKTGKTGVEGKYVIL